MPYKDPTTRRAPIAECGHPVWRKEATQCRPCYLAAKRAEHVCPECGKIIAREGTRCRDCWMKEHTAKASRPTCLDCGKLISWVLGRRSLGEKREIPKRCMPCEIVRRNNAPIRLCDIDGCENKHLAHGLCAKHHSSTRAGGRNLTAAYRGRIGAMPCAVCGYDTIRSHAHRLIPGKDGGKYVDGNCVPLCARCHEEVHKGIRAAPPAIILTPPLPII